MSMTRSTGVLASGSRNLFDWLTGTGFLIIHASAFFLALIILIPWNLYSKPADFWVAAPLVRWAFLLAFHGLLVGVWTLARNVILDVDADNPVDEHRSWVEARAKTRQTTFHRVLPAEPRPASQASTLMAEEWARQWLDEPLSPSDGFDSSTLLRDGWVAESETDEWEPRKDTAHRAGVPEGFASDRGDNLIQEQEPARSPGPLTAAARAARTSEPVDPEIEWRWVEAAATAWLSRQERDTLRHPQAAESADHTGDASQQ
jgi:hypothetical protein